MVNAPDSGLWITKALLRGAVYLHFMRWDNLFDDLESQLEAELGSEDDDLRIETERLRLSRLTLRERLAALCAGNDCGAVRLVLASARIIDVRVTAIGRDWLSGPLAGEHRLPRHAIVPLHGIQSVILSPELAVKSIGEPDAGANGNAQALSARLGIAYVLRDLCRRRTALDIALTSSSLLHGTVDRVGRDHLDLAVHEVGAIRRASNVSHVRLISFDSIEMITTG